MRARAHVVRDVAREQPAQLFTIAHSPDRATELSGCLHREPPMCRPDRGARLARRPKCGAETGLGQLTTASPRADALKLKALRAQLQGGIDALDRGEFVQLDEPDLEAYMTRLGAKRRCR
jgi:hypothetical protein